MQKPDFSSLNKSASNSFKAQRELIKSLGRGDTVLCDTCKKPLTLTVSTTGEPGISCKKGCTSIELEL